MSELLDQLDKYHNLTTLDLASSFLQIEINNKDIQKTVFTVENGHNELVRIQFDFKNAPSTFQLVIDNILLGIKKERCLVYMEDFSILTYYPWTFK